MVRTRGWPHREEGPGSHCSISLPIQWALCAYHINRYLAKIVSVCADQLSTLGASPIASVLCNVLCSVLFYFHCSYRSVDLHWEFRLIHAFYLSYFPAHKYNDECKKLLLDGWL